MFNFIPPQYKLVAFAAMLAASFTSGWHAHRFVKTAEINAAKVEEDRVVKAKEEKGNEKLSEIEKRNQKVREKTRTVTTQLAKNRGVNGERSACVASPDGVRGINTIRRANDPGFDQ